MKAGSSSVFEIPFSGSPQPTAVWTFNEGPLNKAAKSETIQNMTALTLTKVQRADSGVYGLTMENSSGVATAKITVLVLGR